jgi:hypothetical protein
MSNKILKFELFKKGTAEQKPEKQIKVAGGMPKTQKNKPFDQVKRAKLAVIDKTEPDYSKVRKVNEDLISDIQALKTQKINAIADFDRKIADLEAKLSASATTTTTAAPAAAQPAPAPAPAAPAPAAPTAAPTPAAKPA